MIEVAVLDVNQTLSDLSPLRHRLEESGARGYLLETWFASVLRDGIAVTAAGGYVGFAGLAADVLTAVLTEAGGVAGDPREVAEHVVAGFSELDVHPDVPDGLRAFREAGVRVVTLTNGSIEVTRALLERAGVADLVEQMLDVSAAGAWKPAPAAYRHALSSCSVEPSAAALVAVHPWDIDGAGRAGLRTGFLARTNAAYPASLRAPDVTGRTLAEVAAALTA